MNPIAHTVPNPSDLVTNSTSFLRKPAAGRESGRLDAGARPGPRPGLRRYDGWTFRNRGRSIQGTVFCLLAVALLASCATPPSHFYTLSADRDLLVGPASPATVAVGPVTIPDSVNRPEMVIQLGPNHVALDEFNRWAAPLQAEIQRVLIENLARLLGTSRVFRYPQGTIAAPDIRVQIEVLRFESMPGNAALLDAVWNIHGKSGKDVKTGRTTLHEPVAGEGYEAIAAAHSRALGRLSRDLAEAILTLE